MENNVYQTSVDYKSKGQYPLDSTKTCKKEIRRKASTYVLDDGALYYMKGKATKTKVVRRQTRSFEISTIVPQVLIQANTGPETPCRKDSFGLGCLRTYINGCQNVQCARQLLIL
ncbi:hypothetical protein KUCAC02_015570 [Chaenocephalus aceratus]|uniref:Uncharacterized protein n=1 Tax=Chaenocephalus aceratus TaxID=36190 RepID=A0ACB9XXU8_CHAAC|nr:hypothetical protein KUCAC02_015570 [Chaenocephalus aceratus]